jgi:hypothetical protein
VQRSLASGCGNSNDLTSPDRRRDCEHLGNQRLQIDDVVASRAQSDNGDCEVADGPLKFNALVDGEKHAEAFACGAPYERTVLYTRPAKFLNRVRIMPDQGLAERTRQAFIEQDTYAETV